MAVRGGPGRRLTGNSLGGVIRDLNRQTRRTTWRAGSGSPPVPVEGGPDGTAPPAPGARGVAAAVLTTGEDGRARWVFPAPFSGPPVLTALAVDPDPGDEERTVTVALEDIGAWYATVRVWQTRPRRGAGVAAPAGPGVVVHLTARAPAGF